MATQEKWINRSFIFNKSIDDFNELVLSLNQNAIFIKQITEDLDESLLSKSLNKKWNIKENVGHLIDLEELHEKRLDEFIACVKVLTPADMRNLKTNEAGHNEKSISELTNLFIKGRKQFLNKVKTASKQTLTRKAFHGRLNKDMQLVDMLHFINEHDLHHIQTIKDIIAS